MNATTSLVDIIDEKLKNDEIELPVFDNVAMRVYKAVNEDTEDDINNILQEDPVLVGEVLRVANSSFYSGLAEVKTLQDAVVRLGRKQIASLVMAASQKRMYSASQPRFENRLVKLWRHCSAAAHASGWLARKAGYRDQAEEAFLAGLIHDVGKVSLLRIIEDLVTQEDVDLEMSDEVIEMTLRQLHVQHGAKLLEKWNLPDVFREVVLQQETEEYDETNILLHVVRLVDRACAKEGVSDMPDTGFCLETSTEAHNLGLDEIQLAELQMVIEDAANVSP